MFLERGVSQKDAINILEIAESQRLRSGGNWNWNDSETSQAEVFFIVFLDIIKPIALTYFDTNYPDSWQRIMFLPTVTAPDLKAPVMDKPLNPEFLLRGKEWFNVRFEGGKVVECVSIETAIAAMKEYRTQGRYFTAEEVANIIKQAYDRGYDAGVDTLTT